MFNIRGSGAWLLCNASMKISGSGGSFGIVQEKLLLGQSFGPYTLVSCSMWSLDDVSTTYFCLGLCWVAWFSLGFESAHQIFHGMKRTSGRWFRLRFQSQPPCDMIRPAHSSKSNRYQSTGARNRKEHGFWSFLEGTTFLHVQIKELNGYVVPETRVIPCRELPIGRQTPSQTEPFVGLILVWISSLELLALTEAVMGLGGGVFLILKAKKLKGKMVKFPKVPAGNDSSNMFINSFLVPTTFFLENPQKNKQIFQVLFQKPLSH